MEEPKSNINKTNKTGDFTLKQTKQSGIPVHNGFNMADANTPTSRINVSDWMKAKEQDKKESLS